MSHSRKRMNPHHQRGTHPAKSNVRRSQESEIEEVGGGGKGKKKKKKDGQPQKEAKDDSSKVKPKVGVAPFLGCVRTVASKK